MIDLVTDEILTVGDVESVRCRVQCEMTREWRRSDVRFIAFIAVDGLS